MDYFYTLSKTIFADRIGGINFGQLNNEYKFEKIKKAKKEFTKNHSAMQLIDMGVGEPDAPTNDNIVDELYNFAKQPQNQKYADNGCAEFLKSAADYMHRNFNVNLDPSSEIMHSIGSKAALAILPLCFINQNDIAIVTSPGYGVFATYTQFIGGKIYEIKLNEQNNFLPDLTNISESILENTKVLLLNYPNNPTGSCATKEFFEQAIDLAKKYNFIVINDAAYSGLFYHKEDRLSIFNIKDAKDVAIELYSLSKSYNMTGWRIGFVCGNKNLIKAYAHVKSHSDSGQFLAIQKASACALSEDNMQERNGAQYHNRAKNIIRILTKFGFKITEPKAGFFLYTKCPKSAKINNRLISFSSAENFSIWLLENFGISVVPWDECGQYIRLSMTFHDENFVYQELAFRVKNVTFEW